MVAEVAPIVVRPARHADVLALGTIWEELMTFHEQTDPRFALAADALTRWRSLAHDMLSRDDGFLLMAELFGRPVGFVLGWMARNPPIYRVSDVGFISEIAVARHEQRRGVGTTLMNHARAWFLEHKVYEFQLSTAVWNDAARAFWQSLGGEPLLVRYRFPIE